MQDFHVTSVDRTGYVPPYVIELSQSVDLTSIHLHVEAHSLHDNSKTPRSQGLMRYFLQALEPCFSCFMPTVSICG